ncbi:CpsD/CapB family tyrosine-protein kinase [Pseudoroseicyclus aestuarii]|uniref:Capsular exopolysaccharide synthesis family protein n=1 Tax=Pseudoroseicyclus aestuarii TaxID=1795041 RepID=A0A318SPF8_9RHOB|nr:CpsD/CapB family tyrosine-protein kinase [Pseudoroseicyclus aestuarii]PYE82218.1 capsular exopolysaccharide synthesis family protein [Pseudoroseicyclus aestuarii]
MEKIQSAIAKARASRDAATPRETAKPLDKAPYLPGGDPEPSGAATAAHEGLWTALPEYRPKPAVLEANRVTAYKGGHGAAEFDVMRTRLLQQFAANGWRRVAITSPGPGCGKSTLAANLGFSLARQGEQRTLIADLDLRRPALGRILGLEARHSFARVLQGEAAFEDNALRYGENLILASNVEAARNPAELMQSSGARRRIDEIEARYQPTVMLFDLPPLLANDDAMAFASAVDCVILVAAAESTSIKEIDTCERDLAAQTNVLGVVLNKCRYLEKSDKYYGYS